MAGFQDVIFYLEAYGIYDYLLPMLLFFAIIFAALEKTMVLGSIKKGSDPEKPKTNLNLIVSLIISLIIIVNTEVVYFINNFLSNTGILIIIAIVFMLFLALFEMGNGAEIIKSKTLRWMGVVLAILAVLWAVTSQDLIYGFYWFDYFTQELISWLIALGLIIGVIMMLKADSGRDANPPTEERRREG